jgi:hypothetical protein
MTFTGRSWLPVVMWSGQHEYTLNALQLQGLMKRGGLFLHQGECRFGARGRTAPSSAGAGLIPLGGDNSESYAANVLNGRA